MKQLTRRKIFSAKARARTNSTHQKRRVQNRTHATLVEGECSDHCTKIALLDNNSDASGTTVIKTECFTHPEVFGFHASNYGLERCAQIGKYLGEEFLKSFKEELTKGYVTQFSRLHKFYRQINDCPPKACECKRICSCRFSPKSWKQHLVCIISCNVTALHKEEGETCLPSSVVGHVWYFDRTVM